MKLSPGESVAGENATSVTEGPEISTTLVSAVSEEDPDSTAVQQRQPTNSARKNTEDTSLAAVLIFEGVCLTARSSCG